MGGRTYKQCWNHYNEVASPEINHDPWTREERLRFIVLHEVYGNKWKAIRKEMPKKAKSAYKNHFTSAVGMLITSIKKNNARIPKKQMIEESIYFFWYICQCYNRMKNKNFQNTFTHLERKISSITFCQLRSYFDMLCGLPEVPSLGKLKEKLLLIRENLLLVYSYCPPLASETSKNSRLPFRMISDHPPALKAVSVIAASFSLQLTQSNPRPRIKLEEGEEEKKDRGAEESKAGDNTGKGRSSSQTIPLTHSRPCSGSKGLLNTKKKRKASERKRNAGLNKRIGNE